MDKDVLALLLTLVKVNGSITLLRSKGYTHSQIALLIQQALLDNYISMTNDGLIVSNKGSAFIEDYNKQHGNKGSKKWIALQQYHQTKKIDKYDVVFPRRIKL